MTSIYHHYEVRPGSIVLSRSTSSEHREADERITVEEDETHFRLKHDDLGELFLQKLWCPTLRLFEEAVKGRLRRGISGPRMTK